MTEQSTPWFAQQSQPVAPQRRRKTPLALLALLALFAASLGVAAFAPVKESPRSLENGDVVLPATLPEVVAGCAGLVLTPGSGDNHAQNDSGLFQYTHLPPSSGNWSEPAAQPGIYGVASPNMPKVSQAVAALREGRVVIWYNPDIEPQRFAALTSVVQNSPYADRLTVLPWNTTDTEQGTWERNRNITYTSWGVRLNCDVASDTVLADFIEQAMLNPLARDERVTAGFKLEP